MPSVLRTKRKEGAEDVPSPTLICFFFFFFFHGACREVQYGLQSPEWLFGQHKKVEEGGKAGGEGDGDGDGDGDDDGDGDGDGEDGADPETPGKRRGERFLGGELMGEASTEEVEMYERFVGLDQFFPFFFHRYRNFLMEFVADCGRVRDCIGMGFGVLGLGFGVWGREGRKGRRDVII